MSLTLLGERLTSQHRQLQSQVRRRFLSQFLSVAPVWSVNNPGSFDLLMRAAVPLAGQFHQISSTGASQYYGAYRTAESVVAAAPQIVPATFSTERFVASSYTVRETVARRAEEAGFGRDRARSEALTALAGSMTRHVADGARSTIEEATRDDEAAFGWERMTGARPCAFCAMLASRGAVYTSREAASMVGFSADRFGQNYPARYGRVRGNRRRGDSYHDDCNCYVEPRFLGDPFLSEQNRPYRELWYASTRDTNEQLREFRRAYHGRGDVTVDGPRVERALGRTPSRAQITEAVQQTRIIDEFDVELLVDEHVGWAQSVGWEIERAGRIITGVRNENRPGIGGIQWELTDQGTWRVVRTSR